MREQTRAFSIMADWTGYTVCDIDIKHEKRNNGKSSYTIGKLINLALPIIFANTDKPLRLIIKFGFVISLFSFIYATYLIIRKLIYDIAIQGWSSIIISIYFHLMLIVYIGNFYQYSLQIFYFLSFST